MVSIFVFAVLVSGARGQPFDAPAPEASTDQAARGWLYGDLPLWDVADEGLPFRLTLALPSRRDPLAQLLFASEARWTLSLGYARVYNSYDTATRTFKNPGGDAALVSAGRQFRWHPPAGTPPATPSLVIEVGAHYATRRFPADGTRANVKLITGLEWTWPARSGGFEWSAALVWSHFSNAYLFARNAGYDGLALRLGRNARF